MKVLLVLDTIGGVWTYGLELTRALARQGVGVVLAALGEPLSPEQRRAALASPAERVYAYACALEWMEHPWADVQRSGEWLLGVASENDVDLVHLNGYVHAALPWHVPVVVGAHSDVLSWHEAVRGEPAGPGWDRYRAEVAAGLHGADGLVSPTAAMLAALAASFDLPAERVVIPNGRDPEPFHPLEKEPFVMSVGRVWDEAKNAAALDRVASGLPWPVLIAGDGGPGAARRLGHVSDQRLARLLGHAAIFAEPARYEPFGLAALEAGLAGCALVVGDIPSLREVWGDAAAFVHPDDDDALEHELLALIGGEARRHDLGARARERALEYSPQRLGEAYVELYERLLADEPLPAREAERGGLMRFVLFVHSLVSDWNHGNAHFLRGVASELVARGHEVCVHEPREGWSRRNLLEESGSRAAAEFRAAFPLLRTRLYDLEELDVEAAVSDGDVVLVHEWNEPWLVGELGRLRAQGAPFRLLFHDTHHRAASQPREMARYDLRHYDGVLAFGEMIGRLYLDHGWAQRVWTWHEAADTRVFRPLDAAPERDLVWVGNWGDDERTAELHEFLLRPARQLRLRGAIHGVRYPRRARWSIRLAGLRYRGWLPNHRAPEAFARHRVTVHVPRRPYVAKLPGIPTIRPFEAMACGIPLVSAPWDDVEGLFRPGVDHLRAADGEQMKRALQSILADPELAASLRREGLRTIAERHTCAHRVDELLAVADELGPWPEEVAA